MAVAAKPWIELIRLGGPARLTGFDVGNETSAFVMVRLLRRNTGVVLVECIVPPYRPLVPPWLTDEDQDLQAMRMLWDAPPQNEIYVPGDDAVLLMAHAETAAGLSSSFSHYPDA